MGPPLDLCLVTPGHLASTPRLVKAASALAAAGYAVHVVASRHFGPAEPLDQSILAEAKWPCTRVTYHRGLSGILLRLRREFARRRMLRWPRLGVLTAAQALHAGVPALIAAASRVPAAFYFGFGGLAGLVAVAGAATRRRVPYGFDAEDWHEGESDLVEQNPILGAAARSVLAQLLPRASAVTAASPLIADAYARTYGVEPVCLLNVFPLAEAPATPPLRPPPTEEQPAVFYWFSQTVGPGRGLEPMIDVLAHMRTPVRLELRGFVADGYRARLTSRAKTMGARPPVFLSPAPPAEMARLAAHSHLGLSLELSEPANRDLCLSNKIFTYLLAGVPVALTPTTAQRMLAHELGDAAFMLDLSAPPVAAAKLDGWLTGQYERAVTAARDVGLKRFNWDREQTALLTAIRPHLPIRANGATGSD